MSQNFTTAERKSMNCFHIMLGKGSGGIGSGRREEVLGVSF